MSPGAGVARTQAAPMTGRSAAPPAGQPGCSMALANLRRWFRNQLPYRGSIAEDLSVRFLRHAESIAPMWDLRPSLSRSGGLPPTGSNPSFRKCREERFLPIVAMSSGRLFLDRGARQHCPSPLHRRAQTNTTFFQATQKGTFLLCQPGGHFYFALTAGFFYLHSSRLPSTLLLLGGAKPPLDNRSFI